jgi:hypothetical protein
MSTPLICDIHGNNVATIVCSHILDTLAYKQKRGFRWHLDEDGEYQAVCDDCEAMSVEEWKAESEKHGRVLCYECYKSAAALNGISKWQIEGGRA